MMNVTIIEDEIITALFLQDTLDELGHDVLGIFDNSEAVLGFCKDVVPLDLAFVDIQINGPLDGIETAKELKKIYPDISIVFITSFKDTETISRAKEVKPNGYLIKPVIDSDIEAIMMIAESLKDNSILDENIVEVDEYIYHKDLKEIYKDENLIYLSKNERICLDCMISNMNSYTTQENLILNIWDGENNRVASLRELMFRLRKKLPQLNIKSVPNIGYVLSDK